MRKIVAVMLFCGCFAAAYAVPAYPGWLSYDQADGTSVELRLVGDEFTHYLVNRDGQEVRLNAAGLYEPVGAQPTQAQFRARRAASARMQARKVRKEFGVTPNLAPRGIVIMVNYTDQTFKSDHTRAVVDSLCNAVNCTVNTYSGSYSDDINYPSAAKYFADQSNGAYHPIFDVYGPYTLKNNTAYYGENDKTKDANDVRPVNMLIEACKLADADGVDFTKYDSDNDGYIDFVYILYAGKGEASGGSKTTVWPHSWSVEEQLAWEEYYGANPQEYYDTYSVTFVPYLTQEYQREDCFVDGKMINTYACSNELMGSSLSGIGTLCHEFGHVMGLPDFYDTAYGVNSQQSLTPGSYDVMDQGSYNQGGHCPPNYSAWEKYFFGWHTPICLDTVGADMRLIANGQTGYQAYMAYSGNELIAPIDSLPNDEVCYYLENRQQQGWDDGIPGHGLVIWQIRYSREAWTNNMPNNEDNQPRYTLLSAYGTKIGTSSNTYPGRRSVTSVTLVDKALTDIAETRGGLITFQLNGGIPMGLESGEWKVESEKILRNGQLIIRRAEKEYNAQGIEIR